MSDYAAGDEAAFRQLFARYASWLARVLQGGLRSSADAQDLVQQTFLQVHRHRQDYDPSRPFRPWLLTIAMNLKRGHFRRAKARPEAELSPKVEQRLADSRAAHQAVEDRQRLLYAMELLSPAQKEVIALHWLGGVPLPEVAAVVGASLSAVKVRAHRGYAAMRARLETSDPGGDERPPEVSEPAKPDAAARGRGALVGASSQRKP